MSFLDQPQPSSSKNTSLSQTKSKHSDEEEIELKKQPRSGSQNTSPPHIKDEQHGSKEEISDTCDESTRAHDDVSGNKHHGDGGDVEENAGKDDGNGDSENNKTCCFSCIKDTVPKCLLFFHGLCYFQPFKVKDGALRFSLFNFFGFGLYVLKLVYLTKVTINVGQCRETYADTISEGYLTLQHTLLKNWDAVYEGLPYPPAIGKFATYSKDDLKNRINFAVENIYNAHMEATGYFRKMPNDKTTMDITYFDITKEKEKTWAHSLSHEHCLIEPLHGLSNYTNDDGEIMYKYDIAKDLARKHASFALQTMLALNINFQLHSLRVNTDTKDTRCLFINGTVSFTDRKHSGQVVVHLETKTDVIRCAQMNYTTTDSEICSQYTKSDGTIVKTTAIITAILDSIMTCVGLVLLIMVCCPCGFYHLEYKPTFWDIPFWRIVSVIVDICTLTGLYRFTKMLDNDLNSQGYSLYKWDDSVLWIGSGCLLTWVSIIRFIRIHHKFSLLFKTIKKAAWDVVFFLACVILIFVGFWTCTYIVLGPYHVKFRNKSTTAETLFSIINGDEIYATLAILQDSFAGDISSISSFSSAIILIYVSLFTVLVFNLLIALFNSAFEVAKNQGGDSATEKQTLPVVLRSKLEDICGTKPEAKFDCDTILYYLCMSLVLSLDKTMCKKWLSGRWANCRSWLSK